MEKLECHHCAEMTEKDDGYYISNNFVCDYCRDDLYTICARCDDYVLAEESIYAEHANRVYCQYCANRVLDRCTNCGAYEIDSYCLSSYGNVLCRSCSEDYRECYDCGELVNINYDAYYHDGRCEWYCESCYPNDSTDGLQSWDYTPRLRKLGNAKDQLYMGIELEVECYHDSPGETGTAFSDEFDGAENLFWVKEDGSLNNGFEIVSHPATLEYHKRKFAWANMLDWLGENGCKSHDPGTCGLHIHVSRAALTESAQVKLAYFVSSQRERLSTLARRDQNSYARFFNKKLKRGQNCNNESRYEAVNFQNGATVEFRLWRGTLKPLTFMATVELTHAIVKFATIQSCMAIRDNEKAWRNFVAYVNKNRKQYKNLVSYLKEKGLD